MASDAAKRYIEAARAAERAYENYRQRVMLGMALASEDDVTQISLPVLPVGHSPT